MAVRDRFGKIYPRRSAINFEDNSKICNQWSQNWGKGNLEMTVKPEDSILFVLGIISKCHEENDEEIS